MSPQMIGEDSLKPKTLTLTPSLTLETKKERQPSRVELQNSQNPPFHVRQPNQLYHMANLLQITQFPCLL